MSSKFKKVWHAVKWPVIFCLSQILLLFLFLCYFQYQKTEQQLDLHPNWSYQRATKAVDTYFSTSKGAQEIGQYIVDTSGFLMFIDFILLFPIIFHIYQSHQHKFPRYVSKRSKFQISMCAVFIALGTNVVLMWIARMTGFDLLYQPSSLKKSFLIFVLGSGLLGPILEELLFRGIMYDRFQTFLPKYRAGVMTTLLFALFHTNFIQMIYALILGSYFLYCYDRFENMSANVTAHIISNLAVAFLLPTIMKIELIYQVLLLIGSVLGGMYLWKKIKKGTSIYS